MRRLCTSEAVISENAPTPEVEAFAMDAAAPAPAPAVDSDRPAAAPRRRRKWRMDAFIAAITLAAIVLVGWTMHSGRGGGLGLVPVGNDSGDLNAAVTVRSGFPKMTLEIPTQRITAPIDPVTVGKDNYLDIPGDIHRVGWYKDAGQLDGGPGSVLITGHVNWVGQGTGALGNIGQLHLGDVVVTRGQKKPQAWRVVRLVSYLKSGGLPQDIFRKTGKRELVLVTCGGAFDPSTGNYLSNIVVHLQPVTTLLS
jgi:hypothetical protein